MQMLNWVFLQAWDIYWKIFLSLNLFSHLAVAALFLKDQYHNAVETWDKDLLWRNWSCSSLLCWSDQKHKALNWESCDRTMKKICVCSCNCTLVICLSLVKSLSLSECVVPLFNPGSHIVQYCVCLNTACSIYWSESLYTYLMDKKKMFAIFLSTCAGYHVETKKSNSLPFKILFFF